MYNKINYHDTIFIVTLCTNTKKQGLCTEIKPTKMLLKLHYSKPYSFKVLSMEVDAINLAFFPNRTPVAVAVWSLNTFNSCHCLHKYTL